MSTDFIQPGIFNHPRPKKSVLPPPNKRRRIDHKIEEISFDDSKREDYLTGFHKRKVQRIKRAQEENEKKLREERRQMRKQLREERKEELEEHVEAVNKALRDVAGLDKTDADEDDDVWGGIEEVDEDKIILPSVDHEEEYVDEDRYTTVTVEAVDVFKDGLHRIADEDEDVENTPKHWKATEEDAKPKKKWPKKEKPKKFRYESKVERRISRGKQKGKNTAKADARRDR